MGKMWELIERSIRGDAPPAPVARLVGFRLVSAEKGKAVVEIEAGPQHANPMGTLHGGILVDIADAAMGIAFASLLEGEDSFTTLELKINFLRPFWTGKLRALGRVISSGKSVGFTECDIVDAQERLVAKASSTCLTLKGEAAKGR